MIYNVLKAVVVFVAISVSGNAMAQYDTYAVAGRENNCGREYTQAEAAGLWANYCTDSCGGDSCGGCGLFSGKRGRRGGCGGGCGAGYGGGCAGGCDAGNACDTGCGESTSCCDDGCGGGGCLSGLKGRAGRRGRTGGGSSCGCDLGCFGYPSGGCGCEGTARGGCGGGKLRGLFSRSNSNDCGCETTCETTCDTGCDSCGGGCGGRSRKLRCKFRRSAANCGDPCCYFNESVGYEYGNAGMQSCVSGCANGAMATAQDVMAQPPTADDDSAGEQPSPAEEAVNELEKDAAENN